MKMTRQLGSKVLICFFLMMSLIITACGGSSDSPGGSSTYSISGTVSGDVPANVTITLSGAGSGQATTGSDGTYTLSGLDDGSYIVTPSSTGYSFNPSSTVVIVKGKNRTDINFTENTNISFTVSGVVTGTAFANVNVALTGTTGSGTTLTSSNGIYNLAAINGDDIVITPSLTGYRFMPANITQGNVTANITGADFVSGVGNYTIDDLDGTWNFNVLWTDGQDDENTGWQSGSATISTGIVTFSNCYGVSNGTGTTSCPTGVVAFTIDSASGTVTQTSGGSLIGQMASDKALIVATAENNDGSDGAQMFIAQKVTSGTTFSTSDIDNTNWVIHKLRTGADNLWHYGTGTIDSSGIVTETSCSESDGSCTGGTMGTLSVAGSGIVTLSGSDLHGSLSSDKKTIVATATHNGSDYDLMIIQITGQSYTAGNLSDAIYPAQVLSIYDHLYSQYTLPFWAYWTGYIMGGGGLMIAADEEDNNTGNGGSDAFVPYLPKTFTMDTTGRVSETGTASYHGQMSNDGTFIVGTRSDSDSQDQDYYSLTFYLK